MMAFTIKPNWKNLQWIKNSIRKVALKVENAAHDQWATEGGSGTEETQAKRKRIVFVDLIRRSQHFTML
jgi:hypothetical protein